MLEIKNVHKTFNPGTINEKKALNGIDLTLNEGDFVTVIGGNGAGKSTMLNMVAGVYPVDCGSIVIDGVDVTKLPEHKRAKYIGRVFQDPMTGTAANMQIVENLAEKHLADDYGGKTDNDCASAHIDVGIALILCKKSACKCYQAV